MSDRSLPTGLKNQENATLRIKSASQQPSTTKMPSRKRSIEAGDGPSTDESTLSRLRNMWQFANLSQWIYIFGKAELEMECLKPQSTILADIAVALLRLISNHRGLTQEILNSQAQKLYLSRAPERNPFGTEDTALNFQDFDVFTKIIVLQQFTQWVMIHPERFRDKMEEQKDVDQATWRIEPYGWDSEDRTYFVLDDNRVYRLTEAPPAPPPKPKKKRKSFRAGRRTSKRRRTDQGNSSQPDETIDIDEEIHAEPEDDGLGGMTWECLAISLGEVQALLEGFQKTRDENEKVLRKQLQDHLVPILEKQEESRKRKALQRERELLNLAKMANAKRSSRLAGKAEQKKQEEKAREEFEQQKEEESLRRREASARIKMEQERERRMASRGNRLKEREARRVQHEEELAQLSEDSKRTNDGVGRASARRLQAGIEKNRQALMELGAEEDNWIFDCACGLYGQVDDGTHSVACETCNVWQHSKCLNISEAEAERADFHFVCESCRRRQEELSKLSHQIQQLEVRHATPVQAQTILAGNNVLTINPGSEQQNGQFSRSIVESKHSTGSEPKPRVPEALSLSQQKPAEVLQPTSPNKSSFELPPSFGTPASSTKQVLNLDNGPEASLSTPSITREIYRAAHLENGNLPSHAGISPIKHSPRSSFTASSPSSHNIHGASATALAPELTLSPNPQKPILTPPTKQAESTRPIERS
ncbi:unnamed protein product [Clonostachys solani]|uniref:Zinc finger PHD-type domain-containing protein n=1 Tax=Clonostachys solani TaxID=160281 RepID=A0A9N9Z2N1_9HYPO|nr:unnamed protein product [Clonostachys solani]